MNARVTLNRVCQVERIPYPVFNTVKTGHLWQAQCLFQNKQLSSIQTPRKRDAEEHLAQICLDVLHYNPREEKRFEDSKEESKLLQVIAQLQHEVMSLKTKVSSITAEEKFTFADNPFDDDLINFLQTNCQAKKIIFIHPPEKPAVHNPVSGYDITVYFLSSLDEIEVYTVPSIEGRKGVFYLPCYETQEDYRTALWMATFLQFGARTVDVMNQERNVDFIEMPINMP